MVHPSPLKLGAWGVSVLVWDQRIDQMGPKPKHSSPGELEAPKIFILPEKGIHKEE